MGTTWGLRITAAAGTYITPPLFANVFTVGKSSHREHSNYPYRAFAQCKGFLTAAPLRARDLISVPFSGLPLSRPVSIVGLVGRYPTNYLIDRRLIDARLHTACVCILSHPNHSRFRVLRRITPSFPGLTPRNGRLTTCY